MPGTPTRRRPPSSRGSIAAACLAAAMVLLLPGDSGPIIAVVATVSSATAPMTAQDTGSGAASPSPLPVSLQAISIPDTRIISMSPDGRLLAAARPAARYLDGELCTYDVTTLAERACADLSGLRAGFDIGSLRWSPDGSRLVFAERVFDVLLDGDLWLMDAETGDLTNLDDDHADGRLLPRGPDDTPAGAFTLPVSPTFTPDGTAVTYSRSYLWGDWQTRNEIATVPVEGGEPQPLVAVSAEHMGVAAGGMAWSADGRTLYFTSVHPSELDEAGIWAVDGDGTGLRRVIGVTDPDLGPPSVLQVSPRGDALLAFYLRAAASGWGPAAYAVVDPATGVATPLVVSGETLPPLAAVSWAGFSPDGSSIVETTPLGHRVLLRSVDDATETPLVPEGLPNAGPIEWGLPPTWASNGTILLTGAGAFETATLLAMARATASPTPAPSPLASPASSSADGASRVVLRMTVSGGFVPLEVINTTLPGFSLFADGSAVYRPLPAPWPSPGVPLPPLQRAQLSAGQVDELLRFAVGPGGLGVAEDMYYEPSVIDAPFTVFDIDVPGLARQVSVYALGITDGGPDADERARLGALAERLGSFDAQVASGKATHLGDYEPDRYRGILTPVPEGWSQAARPWPFVDLAPADFAGAGSTRYAELRPDQVALVAIVPNGGVADIRLQGADGFDGLLTIRPLLPDEPAVPADVQDTHP